MKLGRALNPGEYRVKLFLLRMGEIEVIIQIVLHVDHMISLCSSQNFLWSQCVLRACQLQSLRHKY